MNSNLLHLCLAFFFSFLDTEALLHDTVTVKKKEMWVSHRQEWTRPPQTTKSRMGSFPGQVRTQEHGCYESWRSNPYPLPCLLYSTSILWFWELDCPWPPPEVPIGPVGCRIKRSLRVPPVACSLGPQRPVLVSFSEPVLLLAGQVSSAFSTPVPFQRTLQTSPLFLVLPSLTIPARGGVFCFVLFCFPIKVYYCVSEWAWASDSDRST